MEKISNSKIFNKAQLGYALHKIVLDAEGMPTDYLYLDVNDSFRHLTGTRNKEIIGKSITMLFPEIGNSNFNWIKEYGEVAINQVEKTFLEYSEPHDKWFKIYAYSPEKYYFVTVFADVTAEKRKYDELQYASQTIKEQYSDLKTINEEIGINRELLESTLFEKNQLVEMLEEAKNSLEMTIKEKDKFFSIIAHDLKSPFNGFIGLTQVLAEELEQLSLFEIKEYTKMLKDSANNLYKLLENLLEWARIQRGMTKFRPELTEVDYIVESIIGFQKANAANKNIEIEKAVPSDLQLVFDVNMINTVLRNLISNALKFTKHGGKIVVSAHEFGDYVQFSVKDSGIGIPKKILDNIFSIGEKTARPGTDGETSTGLGLILCKEYINQHNGEIWVESEEETGSTFYFKIPRNIHTINEIELEDYTR